MKPTNYENDVSNERELTKPNESILMKLNEYEFQLRVMSYKQPTARAETYETWSVALQHGVHCSLSEQWSHESSLESQLLVKTNSLLRGETLLVTQCAAANLNDSAVSDVAEDALVVLQEGYFLLSPLLGESSLLNWISRQMPRMVISAATHPMLSQLSV